METESWYLFDISRARLINYSTVWIALFIFKLFIYTELLGAGFFFLSNVKYMDIFKDTYYVYTSSLAASACIINAYHQRYYWPCLLICTRRTSLSCRTFLAGFDATPNCLVHVRWDLAQGCMSQSLACIPDKSELNLFICHSIFGRLVTLRLKGDWRWGRLFLETEWQ